MSEARIQRKVFKPGVFHYQGFGYGYYYDTKGNRHWGSVMMAQEKARAEGVTLIPVDTLPDSSSHTENWEQYLIEVPMSQENSFTGEAGSNV